jgi:pimeloyl-ACP methyl ester carboxylesterase
LLLTISWAFSLYLVPSACSRQPLEAIDERVVIDVGDTHLFAEISGSDSRAPVLLYLHGGPGSPLGVPIFRAYGGRILENHHVVVYLHQRGIMLSPRVPDDSHRVARYVEDVHRVIEHLRREDPDREINLLGHSWGGVLAYLYVSEHPETVHKLVAVSTPINVESMVRGRVEMVLEWAAQTGVEEAIADLEPLRAKSPIDDAEAFEVLARWTARAYGGWARNLSRERIDAAVDYEKSIPGWLAEQRHVDRLMRDEVLGLDLSDSIESIRVPLLCIVGRHDVDVPWDIVRDEISGYGGPVDFEVFEESHHMPFIDEEPRFADTVVRFLSSGRGRAGRVEAATPAPP